MLIITQMLSRIFCETLTSVSNKHKHKTFTKVILHFCYVVLKCILNHSPRKCRCSLTKAALRACHMIPGQLIAPGQLTDPGVNFTSVHGLTPVTVHMSFSLPRGNFERRATRCTTPDNPPCRGNFSPCEQNAKVAPGQE